MKPIVIVGSINMDLVSRAARIPRPGETILGSDFQMHSGGKGANQAVAVARLGYPAMLLGMLGDDLFGRQLRSTLEHLGVDTSRLGVAPCSSGAASIVLDAQGENTIIVTPGANSHVTPDYLVTRLDVLRSAAMVLAQLEIPLPTVTWLADRCEEFSIPFMLDPAPAQPLPPGLLRRVTWFTPNATEAAFYAGSAENQLDRLFALGLRNLALKQGADGATLVSSTGERHSIPAFRVSAVDTTAAGDAFNGAFAVALVRGLSPIDAARFAAAAAALSVTRPGAQASMPTRQEVETFLASAESRA